MAYFSLKCQPSPPGGGGGGEETTDISDYGVFWSEIGSGFGELGGTPLPKFRGVLPSPPRCFTLLVLRYTHPQVDANQAKAVSNRSKFQKPRQQRICFSNHSLYLFLTNTFPIHVIHVQLNLKK